VKIIAIANSKGGVGKTTTTIALAEGLALISSARVLVIDLDRQCSTSRLLIRGPRTEYIGLVQSGRTADKYLSLLLEAKPTDFSPYVVTRASNVDFTEIGGVNFIYLLPCSRELDRVEKALQQADANTISRIGRKFMEDLQNFCSRENIEWVLIDTPAGSRTVSDIALALANRIVLPTIADPISLEEIDEFIGDLEAKRIISDVRRIPIRILFTKMQVAFMQREFADQMIEGHISGKVKKRCSFFKSRFLQRDVVASMRPHQTSLIKFSDKYGIAAKNILSIAREAIE
jgi:cellulose biosynthesis protein BcsQ